MWNTCQDIIREGQKEELGLAFKTEKSGPLTFSFSEPVARAESYVGGRVLPAKPGPVGKLGRNTQQKEWGQQL